MARRKSESAGLPSEAVENLLAKIDAVSAEDAQPELSSDLKPLLDAILNRPRAASDKVVLLFMLGVKAARPNWHLSRLPQGWRPHDEVLSAGLSSKHLTLHENVTAPGQNIGAKGQQETFDLFGRPRLGDALRFLEEHPEQVAAALDYAVWRFQRSYRAAVAPPSLGDITFSFHRCLEICERLLAEVSGGQFAQLLVTALLRAFHEQHGTGLQVTTHHTYASDFYKGSAGDIDVADAAGQILDAFEVTGRPDWKNRMPDFPKKMERHNLSKFTILCPKSDDPDLNTPEALKAYVSPLGYDVAIVDTESFLETMFALLNHESRVKTFTYFLEYISDPYLCGNPSLIERAGQILTS